MILLVLMLASAMLIVGNPAKAQLSTTQPTPGALPTGVTPSITIETIPYLSFSPNPIGVNQQLLVNVWLQPPINVNRALTQSFQVTITKPDGTTDTVGPLSSYAGDATAWFNYVPTQTGNYSLKLDFLGIYYPAGQYYGGVIVTNSSGQNLNSAYYKPSSTAQQVLIVQQDMIASWPQSPLPTDYWTRPISPNNREWWPILGSYPPTGYGPAIYTVGGPTWDQLYPNTNPHWSSSYNFVPYVQAPNTAHIVWHRQGGLGGLIGGQFGALSTRPNPGYPAIIYAGRAYQTLTKVFNGVTQNVWQCYDIRTGEVFWEKANSTNFDITQVPTIVTYTERTSQAVAGEESMMRGLGATFLYIGSGRMTRYDPWNGAILTNVSLTPITTGTYYAHEFALSVQDLGSAAGANRYRLINWSTNDAGYSPTGGMNTGIATNFVNRIVSNITWPINSLPATTDYTAGVSVYTYSINPPTNVSGTGVTIGQGIMGINLHTGQILYNVTTTAASGGEQFFSSNNNMADNGVFIARMNSGQIKGWDIYTGQLKWSTQLSYPWGAIRTIPRILSIWSLRSRLLRRRLCN